MYYKDGKYKNDKPAFTVFCQFMACIFGFIAGLTNLFLWQFKGTCYVLIFRIEHAIYFLAISFFISYFLFYRNKRYDKIYNKYKNNKLGRYVLAKIIAILLMFFLLLFGLVVSYFQRKYDLCPLYQ